MFDFAWSEFGLIAVVALIFIGPKDLPVAIKTVAALIKKARRMAGEFQGHVDEMVREANLTEVRDQIKDIRNFDLKGEIERAVDQDGSLRSSLNTSAPLRSAFDFPASPPPSPAPATEVAELGSAVPVPPVEPALPAFIPPESAPPGFVPPAFVPPGTPRPDHA